MKAFEKKRLIVEVTPDFHKKLKIKALQRGYTLSQYILGAIIARMGRDD